MRSLRILFALTVGIAVSLVQQVKAAEPIMVGQQQQHHHQHRLTLDSMSQSVRGMEYAVRGAVVILADQLSRELANIKGKNDLLVDDDKYPLFDHIVYTNIGNPQYVLLVVVVVGACSSLGLAVHYVGSFSCWLILSCPEAHCFVSLFFLCV